MIYIIVSYFKDDIMHEYKKHWENLEQLYNSSEDESYSIDYYLEYGFRRSDFA